MNRRQFIAGLAASAVPMAVVGTPGRYVLWRDAGDFELWRLPYNDPSAVFTDLVNAIQQTEKRIAVDLMNLEAT